MFLSVICVSKITSKTWNTSVVLAFSQVLHLEVGVFNQIPPSKFDHLSSSRFSWNLLKTCKLDDSEWDILLHNISAERISIWPNVFDLVRRLNIYVFKIRRFILTGTTIVPKTKKEIKKSNTFYKSSRLKL